MLCITVRIKTECLRRVKKWQSKNLDKVRAYKRKHERENADRALLRVKKYQKAHPEKNKENNRQWAQRHPDKVNAKTHKRRTRISGAGGFYTAEEWANLKRKYNYRCLGCNRRKPLEADHVLPVVHGGTSFISNIQPLCRSCNAKKSYKHIDYR